MTLSHKPINKETYIKIFFEDFDASLRTIIIFVIKTQVTNF